MQQIKDDIKTIGTISTWLLGFLALLVAALVSFIFQDLNIIIVEYNFPDIKRAVLWLLGVYLIAVGNILLMLTISFALPDVEAKKLKPRLTILKSLFILNMGIGFASLFFVFGFIRYFLNS